MSKSSFINGDVMDFSLLRTVAKDRVTSLLQGIEGTKCILLDMSLSRSINIVLEGASIFKMNNVVKLTPLSEEEVETDADAVVFICKSDSKPWELVVKAVLKMREKNSNFKFHLFTIPRKTQLCLDYLRIYKVLNYITIHELDIDLIPIDNDLLSFEYDSTFFDLYLNQDETILKTLTETLLKLQVVFGPFKTIDGFGKNSRSVLNLLQELNSPNLLSNDSPSQISRLILMDRTVDLISLFITPLTYEALIHRFLHFECGSLSIRGSVVGKKDDKTVAIPLNSNDSLFAEIANYNISVIPRYLKEKSNEIQELYKSRPKDTNCSITEMNQFVQKVGTIQSLSDSLQVHLGIADKLMSFTNSPGFGQQWQLERELLESSNIINTIKEMFEVEENQIEDILHYVILYSLINNGLKPKDFEAVRKEFVYKYGFEYLPLLYTLEQLKLVVKRETAGNYNAIKNKLRLIRDDIDGTDPKDINYVTSGFAPISARMIQASLFNTSPLADVAKLVGCDYVHREQEATVEASNNKTLIVFIGGITFLEVSAIRLLKKLDPTVEFVILTTNILKGDTIVDELCKKYAVEKETMDSPVTPQDEKDAMEILKNL